MSTPSPLHQRSTAFWLVVLLLGQILFWVTVLAIVPHFMKKFDEYGLQLPYLTKKVLSLSLLLGDYWFIVMPITTSLLVGGVFIGRYAFRSVRPGNVFVVFVSILVVLSILLIFVSLLIPFQKLADRL